MVETFRVLLLVLIFLPMASAIVLSRFGKNARVGALWLALIHLAVTAYVLVVGVPFLNSFSEFENVYRLESEIKFKPEFVPGANGSQPSLPNRTYWNLLDLNPSQTHLGKPGPRIQFFVGLDGINIWLVALASFMMLISILVSWDSIQDRPGGFYGWLFMLQGGLIGAFLSFDVILFYIFFELTLIPAFFLIGGWGGGSGRRDAARKFFLYTLAGSLLTLIGVIGVVLTNPDADGFITFSLPDLMANVQMHLNNAWKDFKVGKPEKLIELQNTQSWCFVALMAGFMVKVPVWPFHTWLPAAYGEAPIGVTVYLSSLMSKLGAFGILRFVLTLTPDAAIAYGLPVVGWLAAIGILYTAFCAFNQKDMKTTIAYSSISHLGFLVLGLFAFNREGVSGAVLHMVNHGLTIGALFALLAFLLDRYKTTLRFPFAGLMGRYPNFAFFAFFLILASIGLPGLNNFASEMLMMAGLFDPRNPDVHSLVFPIVAAIGILLSAWYMLTLVQHIFFNPLKEPEPIKPAPLDISGREVVAFASLSILCLALGLLPQYVLSTMSREVKQITAIGDKARERVGIPLPPDDTPPPTMRQVTAPKNQKTEGKGKGGNKGGKGGKKDAGGSAPLGKTGTVGKMLEDE